MELVDALKRFAGGGVVMIFDSEDREGEVDLAIRADAVTPDTIAFFRKFAGGLICFATKEEVVRGLGLSFETELLRRVGLGELVKAPSYGDEPAFVTYLNHVSVRTGIRDVDRARTIRELAEVVKLYYVDAGAARRKLYSEFYAPGHVPVLGARIGRRLGHTELAVMLSEAAGAPPAVVIVEVLGDSREAVSLDEARELARFLGVPLLTAKDITGLWSA